MAKSRDKSNGEVSPDKSGSAEDHGAPQIVGDTTAAAPDRDRVATRAYELYQARGGSDGQALEDWLEAERELENGEEDRRRRD